MTELDKLFEAIGNRRLAIGRGTGSDGQPGTWRARMCVVDGEVCGEGVTPALAIRAALLLVLADAQEKEREMESFARDARDVVARLRSGIEKV